MPDFIPIPDPAGALGPPGHLPPTAVAAGTLPPEEPVSRGPRQERGLVAMLRDKILRALGVGATALLPFVPAVEGQAPPRALGRPSAEFPEPFTRVAGVRELRDGRVIVLDAQDQSIHLVDLRSGSSSPIGRQGDGPGEFRLPLYLYPLSGDSSAVFDMVRPNGMLVITPDGRAGGTYPITGADGGLVTRVNVDATDGAGRPYGKANIGRALGDSVEIVRLDPRSGRWEKVGMVCNKGFSDLHPEWGCGRRAASVAQPAGPVRMTGGPTPFVTTDQWAVAIDGRIAVVSADPYRVTMISPDGAHRVGPNLPATPIRVTEAHKAAWLADARKPVATISSNGNGQTVTSWRPSRLPEPTAWPDRLPPFLPRAVTFASDGTLWVHRTTADAAAPPTYDLIGPAGTVLSRLVLPTRTRLVGFGNGTVYLMRIDEDDLEYLQRYPLPRP